MSTIDKRIIQRALPLTQKYNLIGKKYIPLLDGYGCCCQNCGKLIANIATVRAESGKVYDIGFDCLETFLINNSLLDSAGVEEYEKVRKMIPKILRASKQIKETIERNRAINITGILLEKPMFEDSKFYPFYWLKNNQTTGRDNDLLTLKDVDFSFLVETLKNIFPNLSILTK